MAYLIGTVFSAVLYFALNRGISLIAEHQNLTRRSSVLGLAVVGLEAGSIYMYKADWNISSGQLVYSILLAACLILIGVIAYHESISTTKIIGILVCMFGLF